jgi:2-polyprenyl-3-methyl-5-hydroxy-6-metoxy-1,4-benzoquinol methylase
MTSDPWNDIAINWDDNADAHAYADMAFESWQRKVAPLISELSLARVLDFGCGTGLLTAKLAPLCGKVVALDSSVEMIKRLEAKVAESRLANVTPLVSTIDRQALVEHSSKIRNFDLVVASSVCSFLPDFDTTLTYVVEAMSPGAILVQWDWALDMPEEMIRATYAASGLRCLSIENEFEMVSREGALEVVMAIGRRSD